MNELLQALFAVAVELSGLPATDTLPSVEAMPYPVLLKVVCADLAPRPEVVITGPPRFGEFRPLRAARTAAPPRGAVAYARCLAEGGLVAAYLPGQYRIVYRNDLDLDDDAQNSFIVHEFVHALQDRQRAPRTFDSCENVLAAEREAYAVQQKYLRSRGELLRVGDRLRYVSCEDIY